MSTPAEGEESDRRRPRPAAPGRTQFFIANAEADRDWADWISWQLESAGYSLTNPGWQAVAGMNLLDVIDKALRHAERTIAVVSETYLHSDGEQVGRSVPGDRAGVRNAVIPIRVENVPMTGLFENVTSIDLFDVTAQEAEKRLPTGIAQALKGNARPTAKPRFPGRKPAFPGTPSTDHPQRRPAARRSADPPAEAVPRPSKEPQRQPRPSPAPTRPPAPVDAHVRTYRDFEMVLRRDDDDHYLLRYTDPRRGVWTAPVTLRSSSPELTRFLSHLASPRRSSTGRLGDAENEAREFGSALFTSLFHDEVRSALRASRRAAESAGAGLRIRLRLEACPELSDLPWEFMFGEEDGGFLALSEWTPLVRGLNGARVPPPLAVAGPLRLLVHVASPVDYHRVDAAAEVRRLSRALRASHAHGYPVEVSKTSGGTLEDLQDALRDGTYHVFHYIGHGVRGDDATGDGHLVFEGANRLARAVSGTELAQLLGDHRTLRLAVLNACEGARATSADPFAGVAQALIRQGVPAAVAMQFEVTDAASVVFAREFYETIAAGLPVEASVTAARKALRSSDGVLWGTPVLHLKAGVNEIFSITRQRPRPRRAILAAGVACAMLAVAVGAYFLLGGPHGRSAGPHPAAPTLSDLRVEQTRVDSTGTVRVRTLSTAVFIRWLQKGRSSSGQRVEAVAEIFRPDGASELRPLTEPLNENDATGSENDPIEWRATFAGAPADANKVIITIVLADPDTENAIKAAREGGTPLRSELTNGLGSSLQVTLTLAPDS
ncbi:CHAT domain-containing protein [Pseudofrankia asymbiotica]|uniref:TIR domain-containing protein n=1 Tax=Pseudofrankia asymbiotica TaxID=1834516 RepID=A0A1V2HZW0_9ACTN|nr:CHAT domain-containing protein [Pseudofrankia asymbiotica]ONH22363.1 hypothetical protein BL253_35925 [Pseudofrankia asymbiotica]